VPFFAHRMLPCLLVTACLCVGCRPLRLARIIFNQGKTITFIIGSAPGGGYDTYSRMFANHVGEHLGGRPRVIAQEHAGAQAAFVPRIIFTIRRARTAPPSHAG